MKLQEAVSQLIAAMNDAGLDYMLVGSFSSMYYSFPRSTSTRYRFVRNPMAVAGILQGIAVGWLLGSVPVIIYSLTGIVAWHVFVRPAEEQEFEGPESSDARVAEKQADNF